MYLYIFPVIHARTDMYVYMYVRACTCEYVQYVYVCTYILQRSMLVSNKLVSLYKSIMPMDILTYAKIRADMLYMILDYLE